MTEASQGACYRHPNRASYVLCQRCGRTICPECQNQAPVGVHCPECVKEARQSHPRRRPALLRSLAPSSERPIVTYAIMAVTVAVFVLQFVTGDVVTRALLYAPVLTYAEPWRMVTSIFAHSGIFHILLNMYALFLLGPALEHFLGRARFIALYLLCGFGGSVLVLLVGANNVLGASGAIFGLFGAYFIVQRKLGGATTQIVVILAINFAISFFVPLISWQAHLGGLIVGAAIAYVYLHTRNQRQQPMQIALIAAIAAALLAGMFLPVLAPAVFPIYF